MLVLVFHTFLVERAAGEYEALLLLLWTYRYHNPNKGPFKGAYNSTYLLLRAELVLQFNIISYNMI